MYYVLGDHGGGSREGSSVFDRKESSSLSWNNHEV